MEFLLFSKCVTGICTGLVFLGTSNQIRQHLYNNNSNDLRRLVLRIILMAPVYSLTACLAIYYPATTIYLDMTRDFYEAFVIYSFYKFLNGCLEFNVPLLLLNKCDYSHSYPFCCLKSWSMPFLAMNYTSKEKEEYKGDYKYMNLLGVNKDKLDFEELYINDNNNNNNNDNQSQNHQEIPVEINSGNFIFHTQLGTLQYVLLKLITSIVIFGCHLGGVYSEGSVDFNKPYVYIAVISNISQIWAMYCLICFYLVCKKELAFVKPLNKFMVVKAVVFFTFWQGLTLLILSKLGCFYTLEYYLLEDNNWRGHQWDRDFDSNLHLEQAREHVLVILTNILVSIEMVFAMIAHAYVFHWEESYKKPGAIVRANKLKVKNYISEQGAEYATSSDDSSVYISLDNKMDNAATHPTTHTTTHPMQQMVHHSMPQPMPQTMTIKAENNDRSINNIKTKKHKIRYLVSTCNVCDIRDDIKTIRRHVHRKGKIEIILRK